MADDDDDAETEYVQTLVSFPEVFVYKVPPLTSLTAGHRAETWKLESPFATCNLKVLAKGDDILLQLFDIEKKNLVVACPIALDVDQTQPGASLEYWLEQAKDSSRYFVIRLVDQKTKKQALLGVGFRERNPAFEFQEALGHHFKRVNRMRGIVPKKEEELPKQQEDDDDDSTPPTTTPAAATTVTALKQPIKLNIPSLGKAKQPPTNTNELTSAFSQMSTTSANTKQPVQPPAAKPPAHDEDIEWGEFQ